MGNMSANYGTSPSLPGTRASSPRDVLRGDPAPTDPAALGDAAHLAQAAAVFAGWPRRGAALCPAEGAA